MAAGCTDKGGEEMEFKIMEANDAASLAAFEIEARMTEPGILYGEIDAKKYAEVTIERMADPLYSNTRVILAAHEGRIVGRCDFTVKGSFMDGFRSAYVDWIYVLKEHRHQKVGQGLIGYLESYLREHQIEEYFLITAHNQEAQSFYTHFKDYVRSEDWVLRKGVL